MSDQGCSASGAAGGEEQDGVAKRWLCTSSLGQFSVIRLPHLVANRPALVHYLLIEEEPLQSPYCKS